MLSSLGVLLGFRISGLKVEGFAGFRLEVGAKSFRGVVVWGSWAWGEFGVNG